MRDFAYSPSGEASTSCKIATVLAGVVAAATEQSTTPGETSSHQLPSTTNTKAQPLIAPTLTPCTAAVASAESLTSSHLKMSG